MIVFEQCDACLVSSRVAMDTGLTGSPWFTLYASL